MEKAKRFYVDLLGSEIIEDLGANVSFAGGFALQSSDIWKEFINKHDDDIVFGNNANELVFEEDHIEAFIAKLDKIKNIKYVHQVMSWGQRVVRFYDPDKHLIEVGENIATVVKRFLDSGLSIEETAARMDVPLEFVVGLRQ